MIWFLLSFMYTDLNDDLINLNAIKILGIMWVQTWNTGIHFNETREIVNLSQGDWIPVSFMLSDPKYLINSKCSPILGTMWVQIWNTCFYKLYIHVLLMGRNKKCNVLICYFSRSNHFGDKTQWYSRKGVILTCLPLKRWFVGFYWSCTGTLKYPPSPRKINK